MKRINNITRIKYKILFGDILKESLTEINLKAFYKNGLVLMAKPFIYNTYFERWFYK